MCFNLFFQHTPVDFFNFFFRGLGWPWVESFVGFNTINSIILYCNACFPIQPHLGYPAKHSKATQT